MLLLLLALQTQRPAEATFFVLAGADTIAVERTTRTATRLDGNLVELSGGTKWEYALTFDAQMRSVRIENAFYRTVRDTAPLQRAVFTFRGDSAIVDLSGNVKRTDRVSTRAGAVPWVNPSAAMLDQVLRQAKAMGGSPSVEVPVLVISGGQTLGARVTWVGADSATVDLGGVVFRASVGAGGALRGAVIPQQNVRVVRVEGIAGRAASAPRATDYSAPPDAPYTAQEVTVRTPSGLRLTGTLTLPKSRPASGAPAVVTITGSGAQTRDEEIGIAGYRPFRQVADTLGRRGIAVLRLDDRGAGGSDKGPANATTEDFANDIRAALAFLRARPEIDGSRLGLVGHSEGGIIAPMVAASDPALKGIVLLAGSAYTGRRILAYQNQYSIANSPIPADKRDSVLRAATRTVDSAMRAPGWLRFFADYDPLVTARKVKVPVLVLQGATDRQVTAEQADTLAAALRAGGNRDVTLRTFPQTNHLFLADPEGNPRNYATLSSKSVRAEVLGAVADWLVTKLR